jgi:hypothetical protein
MSEYKFDFLDYKLIATMMLKCDVVRRRKATFGRNHATLCSNSRIESVVHLSSGV